MNPKVSVGLRSYNQKEFLREAIESILIQDYENLEIVVGEDASTDGTRDMLEKYDQKNPGLFKLIFNPKNLGWIRNGNVILEACTGKYIAWLDGDDVFLPGKIKKQVELMEKQPQCVVCYHNVEMFGPHANEGIKLYGSRTGELVPREGGEEILFHNFYILPSASMTLRDACPKWNDKMVTAADNLFFIEVTMNGKVCYLPEILSRYRKHPDSNTSSWTSEDRKVYLHMTYAILDAKYPRYVRHTRLAREFNVDLYHAGIKKIMGREMKAGRKLLLESLRHGWVSWKWFGWYVMSFLNIPLKTRN